ncbi:family 1 glycosylhydrolase [Sphingomonas sp. ASY06-1R]|uniref:family 1 glycosylhydrolase n=1 Tax=Sphingomonas sp. ASY06-1R TaxID=3445771 RepID=UPI003FA1A98E
MGELELWGGPECTVNRLGDRFGDQLHATGHHDRISDLDLFASLGIRALRYPILWERMAPEHPDMVDWNWSDARVGRLQALGIRPIAGLVHHGSGPKYTDLLADSFAPGLANFARMVAERYPWIEDWTPVNEPVTTARFSALYGLWYPHHREERSFWLALLNQIEGVAQAMAEIRRVNPAARLIQTDDLGRTYATVALREQAAFDNVRRWMSWDLLCGKVVPGHALWRRLCGFGLEDRLRRIADRPCPPDVIGVNHYLTSDRFLDHRLQRYPRHLHGSNGQRAFADTEAVRVLDPPPPGLRGVLLEAWARYRIPLAVTEIHNGCTREEQMRWMAEAWQTAGALREQGVDVQAVTSWALLGSQGWNTLLTGPGTYEPGIYDVSSGAPQPTAMVDLLRSLVGEGGRHPVAADAGWWRRSIRLVHPAVPRPAPICDRTTSAAPGGDVPPLLLMGEDVAPLVTACENRGMAFQTIGSPAQDGPADVDAVLARRPWAIATTCAAGPNLARACATRSIPLVDASGVVRVDELLDRLIDASATADRIAA